MPTLPLVIVLAIIGTRMPALNAEVLANVLDVGDQVPSSVRFQRRIGRALITAALVEVHDSVFFGVEEAALFGI